MPLLPAADHSPSIGDGGIKGLCLPGPSSLMSSPLAVCSRPTKALFAQYLNLHQPCSHSPHRFYWLGGTDEAVVDVRRKKDAIDRYDKLTHSYFSLVLLASALIGLLR
jgi:hypothetical protein